MALIVLSTVLGLLGILALFRLARRFTLRHSSRERLVHFEPFKHPVNQLATTARTNMPGDPEQPNTPLRRWLIQAGYRSSSAPGWFVWATLAGCCLGGLLGYSLYTFGMITVAVNALSGIPSGVGKAFVPLVYLSPVLALTVAGLIPTLKVRGARRARITQLEKDLPVTLELLASLSESGVGFDAALTQVLNASDPHRFLIQEFRTFQAELFAGRSRIDCLWRLVARTETGSLTVLASALVQAEQLGAGVAEILRQQSVDLRERRRERALGFAATLSSKLMLPLVVCFLPGFFVAVLGPILGEIIRMISSLTGHPRI